LLEGKNVNLRAMEKDDLPLIAEWLNRSEVYGAYNPLLQVSRADTEKMFESPNELKLFMVEKKDGTRVGYVAHFYVIHVDGRFLEIAYSFLPNERGKGYCTEAATMMVDYLFLSKDVGRIQAETDERNIASQRVLEKVGFTKEGVLRKLVFIRGEWRDAYLYSILREEWKEPRIVTRTV